MAFYHWLGSTCLPYRQIHATAYVTRFVCEICKFNFFRKIFNFFFFRFSIVGCMSLSILNGLFSNSQNNCKMLTQKDSLMRIWPNDIIQMLYAEYSDRWGDLTPTDWCEWVSLVYARCKMRWIGWEMWNKHLSFNTSFDVRCVAASFSGGDHVSENKNYFMETVSHVTGINRLKSELFFFLSADHQILKHK